MKDEKCSRCDGDFQEEGEVVVNHSCPYAEEINDNYDPSFCNCCKECRRQCCMDI